MELLFVCLAAHDSEFRRWPDGVDRRICQTFAASPAEPGELPLGFSVDIAVSALSSAIPTPDITTSDRDPSACSLPAPFLQTTATVAPAPPSCLRTPTNF